MGHLLFDAAFVGRTRELTALWAAMERARAGRATVVLVGGEAGVGKTRLITEFGDRARASGATVLVGGCIPLGEGVLPYAPLVEALTALVAGQQDATLDELLGPSTDALGRLLQLPGAAEEASTAAGSEQYAQARLFEAVLTVLDRLSRRHPVILVLEDLHWADRSTRDLLAVLAHRLGTAAVVLVATYRSDDLHRHHPLRPLLAELDRRAGVEHLQLDRFDRAELDSLLTTVLGERLPEGLADAIFVRSAGNAFFAEELLAAARRGDRALPPTVQEVVLTRVEALSGSARRLLDVVAVAGRGIDDRLLAAAADLEGEQLAEGLGAATSQHLLLPDPARGAYGFRHALVGEVLYDDLLPAERRRTHAVLAVALTADPRLASGSPAVAAAELAAHWSAADDVERALPALINAGRAANQAYAFAEAQHDFERALGLWDRVPDAEARLGVDRVWLLEQAVEAAFRADDQPRAVALAEQALHLLDPIATPVRAALLHERLGHARWLAGDQQALAAFDEAVRLLPAEPASAERARVVVGRALTLGYASRMDESLTGAEEALRIARSAGARREEGQALWALGAALTVLGHPEAANPQLRAARQIAEEVGDIESFVLAWLHLADNFDAAGRPEEALAELQGCSQATGRLGLAGVFGGFIDGGAARLLFRLGRWEEATQRCRTVLEREHRTSVSTTAPRLLLARIQVARGNFAEAAADIKKARKLPPRPEPQFSEPFAEALAELALAQGRLDDARAVVEQTVAGVTTIVGRGVTAVYALGLRAQAELAERARARRDHAVVEDVQRAGEHLLHHLRQATDDFTDRPGARLWASEAADIALCQAEHSRVTGQPDPALWPRWWRGGAISSSPGPPPTRACATPRPCWPASRTGRQPPRRCARPTVMRSRSAPDPSRLRSNSSRSAAASASPPQHRAHRRRSRRPPPRSA